MIRNLKVGIHKRKVTKKEIEVMKMQLDILVDRHIYEPIYVKGMYIYV